MPGRDASPHGPSVSENVQPRPACPLPKTVRRIGAVAFVFFLLKGLVWLSLFGLGAAGLMGM